jgi:glycosyltransferase involved in cell wall biosynthesis
MGLDNLVTACGILKTEGYQFQVLIGGTGPLQDELQTEISQQGLNENVHLLGRISEEMLPLAYAAADCFVLPTRSLECFGLIVLESFACDTPVIATPVGAIPEVMGNYQNQEWLTSDTSASAIADRMGAFLNGELKTAAANLREHALVYSTSIVHPRLEKVIVG